MFIHVKVSTGGHTSPPRAFLVDLRVRDNYAGERGSL